MDSRDFCFPITHPSRRLLESAWFAEQGFAFQRAMYDCGVALAEAMLPSLGEAPGRICMLTQAEDADGIAKGVRDALEAKGIEVRLMCLWSRVDKVYEGASMSHRFSAPSLNRVLKSLRYWWQYSHS